MDQSNDKSAGSKPPWLSRGVVGSVVVIVATVAGFKGWSVDADKTTDLIMQAMALIGGIVALWGRLQAEQPIRWTRGTVPGGSFNPKAEVRKAEKGHAKLQALAIMVGAFLLVGAGLFIEVGSVKAEVGSSEKIPITTSSVSLLPTSALQLPTSPTCGGRRLAEWVQVVPIVDERPFCRRLWSSLTLNPTVAFHFLDGNISASLTALQLKGGAEF